MFSIQLVKRKTHTRFTETMCKIMGGSNNDAESLASKEEKAHDDTHGLRRGSKMCHKQPQTALCASHKYAHTRMHAHTSLLRATIVQKRAVKAADHSFAEKSRHCHFLLAEPTTPETERKRFVSALRKHSSTKCSVSRSF